MTTRLPPPAGGRRGRRPMRAPAPKTDDVAASARGPPSALRGRAPAASLREGDRRSVRFRPLWHRGSRRRASTATALQAKRLLRKPQATSPKRSRAAELGRAADQRVPRDQNGRGSMHSRHDPQNPGSWLDQGTRVTRALRSLHTQRSSFLRGYPLPRGRLEPRLSALLLAYSRVGAASTQPPPFFL